MSVQLAPHDARLDRSAVLRYMTDAAVRLARRNEALEDFAALVAHELKAPLEAALMADDPRAGIVAALDLVDSLLQVAAGESPCNAWASLRDCVAETARPHSLDLAVSADQAGRFPLPAKSLCVILRNLLANAAAAGADRVDVSATYEPGQWCLIVDDDGVGLEDGGEYQGGSGIGLELCRRIARRHGGRLELLPRGVGGTRAILTLERAA